MKSKAGFTLVELLIVMAIVAILGVIAVPSYRNYVVGARQNAAEQALLRMAGQMENCYSLNQTYLGCMGDGNAGINDALSANDINDHYQMNNNRTAITARNYTLAIEAIGGQANSVQAGCTILAVDRVGRKLVVNNGALRVDGNGACWQ